MGITVFQSSAMNNMSVTSKTRPANPPVGLTIYETDTMMDRRWDGQYWEIIRWYGQVTQGRASTGPMPAMGRRNDSVVLTNGQYLDVNSWPTTYLPTGAMATASTSGGPLFTTDATYTYAQEKGRVRAVVHAWSDNGAAHFQDVCLLGPNNGMFGNYNDRRISPSGFGGAGALETWVTEIVDVVPGDRFGMNVGQAANPAANTTLQCHMQLYYL